MTSEVVEDGPQPRIQSVARAARILEVVADSEDGLTPKQVGELLDIRLPTTYHLLQTLEAVGLLRRDGSVGGRYVLGFGVGRLTRAFDRQVSAPEQLALAVRALAERTGEAVYGSGWSDDEIVILTRQLSTHPVGVAALPIGLAGHAYARASGKMLLALLADDERERYLARHEYVALTSATLSADDLLARLDDLRAAGYAVDEEEHTPGVSCVAAPIAIAGQQFCLALSAPTERFRAERDHLVATVLAVANGS